MFHQPFDFLHHDLDALLSLFPIALRSHSHRVALSSSMMAEYAGEVLQVNDITMGANLTLTAYLGGTCHDVGKLLFPALSTDEADYLRHPASGVELLEQHKEALFASPAQAQTIFDIVRHHHERPDGKGFPDGLTAKDISLGAALCAVANWLDHRLFSEERTQDADSLFLKIEAQAGSLFCESAVVCCERAWPRLMEQYTIWDRFRLTDGSSRHFSLQ